MATLCVKKSLLAVAPDITDGGMHAADARLAEQDLGGPNYPAEKG